MADTFSLLLCWRGTRLTEAYLTNVKRETQPGEGTFDETRKAVPLSPQNTVLEFSEAKNVKPVRVEDGETS